MSSWSMNDGSNLSGTITTNTSSGTEMNVSGGSTAFTTEVAVGDVILTAGGNSYRVKSITSNTALVLTENVTSAESGVAADVRRPPLDFDSAAPHINTNILGVSAAESLGGLDNITSVNVGDTTLGTLTTIGGNTYRGSAPTVTIPAATLVNLIQSQPINTSMSEGNVGIGSTATDGNIGVGTSSGNVGGTAPEANVGIGSTGTDGNVGVGSSADGNVGVGT